MMIYGECSECGGFPINDATGLCEACEEEARFAGELGQGFEEDDELAGEWEMEPDPAGFLAGLPIGP